MTELLREESLSVGKLQRFVEPIVCEIRHADQEMMFHSKI